MKKTLLLLVLSSVCMMTNAQVKWDFPVKLGTPEWANLKTYAEMVKVCQIPDNVLTSSSTKEIVEYCLNYPLIMSFFAYGTVQEGIDRVESRFNGLQELLERSDNAISILDYLEDCDLASFDNKNMTTFETAFKVKSQLLAESLLKSSKVITNTDDKLQKAIAKVALENLLIKGTFVDFFGSVGMRSSAELLYAYLCKIDSSICDSPLLKQFANGMQSLNAAVIKELMINYSSIINK